jgi:UV DNA damage endonuclease
MLRVLSDRILNNVRVTHKIIEYCGKRGWNYRASSDMFPVMSHKDFPFDMVVDCLHSKAEILDEFKKCADTIRKYNVRVSMHPGQFTVLCSANPNVVINSIHDIKLHSYIMDLMELPRDYSSPINIHMGLYKGNLKEISKRFVDSWNRLCDGGKKRLVIENEDKGNSWAVSEMVDHIQSKISIPFTFDYHHHKLNQKGLSEKEAFNICYSTWGNVKPLFHYSESCPNNPSNPRAHSMFALKLPSTYGKDIDVDWELKGKDDAIEKSFK